MARTFGRNLANVPLSKRTDSLLILRWHARRRESSTPCIGSWQLIILLTQKYYSNFSFRYSIQHNDPCALVFVQPTLSWTLLSNIPRKNLEARRGSILINLEFIFAHQDSSSFDRVPKAIVTFETEPNYGKKEASSTSILCDTSIRRSRPFSRQVPLHGQR